MKIKETIVVEGRDDTAAIKRSIDALTIETHGYGIRPATWDLIAKADETTGIIVFTDPDHAGEQIRKRILEKFPGAREAFLDREDAEKDGDIGIENASPESIRKALEKARAGEAAAAESYSPDDMFRWGLAGTDDAAKRRTELGKRLGLGFANSKTFLQRLNRFGISREEIEEALRDL
ncbi:MAG: ribonuclease M5 [Clostridia bacterium]|nr:ribonuclease M5 [Clostridia bacterium]